MLCFLIYFSPGFIWYNCIEIGGWEFELYLPPAMRSPVAWFGLEKVKPTLKDDELSSFEVVHRVENMRKILSASRSWQEFNEFMLTYSDCETNDEQMNGSRMKDTKWMT